MTTHRRWTPIVTVVILAFAVAAINVAAQGQGQGRGNRGFKRPTVVRGTPSRPLTPPGFGRVVGATRAVCGSW